MKKEFKKEFIIFVPDVEPKIWDGGIIMGHNILTINFDIKIIN